jgi:hypothetical protein
MESQRVLEDFVAAYREGRTVAEDDARFKSILELDRMAAEDPEAAWVLILGILERDQSAPVIEMLAAGPLEDLIEYHGAHFVDRIEEAARRDSKFRRLLGGVWEASTPDIWGRVVAARENAW